jgi:hypothetical protein
MGGIRVKASCVAALAAALIGVTPAYAAGEPVKVGGVLGGRPLSIIYEESGGNGFKSPKLADIAGPAADGALVGRPWFIAKKDSANQKPVAAREAKDNEEPDLFAAQAYDAKPMIRCISLPMRSMA